MDAVILENYNARIDEYEDLYTHEKNSCMKIHMLEVLREMKFARRLIERLISTQTSL